MLRLIQQVNIGVRCRTSTFDIIPHRLIIHSRTWRGEPGEEWSTAQGLESILISIQSLMSPNPWENEPGFESCKRDSDKKEARLYAAKIKHETLRISIVERLEELLNLPGTLKKEDDSVTFGITDSPEEPYAPFSDLCKRRFLWYYIVYLNTIETEQAKHGSDINDGKAFKLTPFESATNGMSGIYAYSSLKERLNKINDALQQESKDWELEGLRRIDSPVALNFSNRFGRLSKDFTSRCETPVDFALINKNPFAWRITLFGKPMTNLDGGVFNIKIVFSVNFPNLQPRVKVETSLFHQRVSPANGSLCYFPSNPNEPESHVEAIIAAIEDEAPPYDPRTLVNPEASKLRWGSQDDRKTYNRRLRRSAQDSTS